MEVTLRREREELVELYGEDMLSQQIELEERMVVLGRDQIRKQIAKAREHGNESGTNYGQALIARGIDNIAAAIGRFIEKAKQGAGRRHIAVKYLEQVESDVAAYIALRLVVDSLTGKNQVVQSIAVKIGKRIEDEVRFAQFKDTDARMYNRALQKAQKGTSYHRKKATMAGYERRFGEEEWKPWPEQDCLHIGTALLDMVMQTGLVAIGDKISSRRDTVKVIEPCEQVVEWVERENSKAEMLHPQNMPMVVKPLPWTDPFNGGYLTQDAQGRNALVKSNNSNYLTELADHADQMPMVFDAVNALQETKWAINKRVHGVLEQLWELDLPLGKIPEREDIGHCPCPSCGQVLVLPKTNTRGGVEHDCFVDEEVLREWKREAYKRHNKNISTRSKRLHLAKTLRIARVYSEYDAIYFPYQLDFRGRIYAIPSFNPQGNDVTKGLLHFSEGKAINDGVAAGWLAIHGANVYGYDKASLEDRIQWVEDHEEDIYACAAEPLVNRFWCDADKPFQFLAFCFEWAGFMEQGYGYVSHLPVALDGSCSGIQHFSAMLLDREGGKAVNLLPQETPADIYQRVCDRVISKLKKDADQLSSTIAYAIAEDSSSSSEGEEEKAYANSYSYSAAAIFAQGEQGEEWSEALMAAGWLTLQPDRKTTKRQVMTLPYGSTLFSCREYTNEWYCERINANWTNPFPEHVSFKATNYLSGLIWDSITEVVVGARKAMDWLQKCAKVVAAEELPVYWTTPVGFRVMQQYRNTTSRRVKTKLGEAIVKLSLSEETKTIDKRRMQNAISPNFVHSMDATHLIMSVGYALMNGINSFAMIHDSFGCHAADTNMLSACLRQAFVDLYTDMDVLDDFRQQIERQVDEADIKKIPALPAKGDLDLEQVRESDFFFA